MNNSLEEDIVSAGNHGFEAIEIWWSKLEKYLENHDTKQLKALLEENNVKVASICPFLVSPFRDVETCRTNFKKAVDIAPQIDCDTIIICPDFQPASKSKEEALAMHGEELKMYADWASKDNIQLAIEPISLHTLVRGPIEALDLIERAGSPANVGVLLDTFHYLRSGVTEEEIRQIPIEKLLIVHINDSEDKPLNELADTDRVYPTLGVIDLAWTINLLKEMGYDKYLSVEIFRQEYWDRPVDENVRDSKKYLKKLLDEVL